MVPSAIAPGAPAGSYSLSDFERISPSNGSLSLSIPLATFSGRGAASFVLPLNIESIRWKINHVVEWRNDYPAGEDVLYAFHYNYADTLERDNIGRYSPGAMHGRHFAKAIRYCQSGMLPVYESTYTLFTFSSADGTEYQFHSASMPYTLGHTDACNIPDQRERGREFVTTDGSNIRFLSDADISDESYPDPETPNTPSLAEVFHQPGYMMFPDGTSYRIGALGHVESIRDRNGNLITFSYRDHNQIDRIVDSLGRQTEIRSVCVDATHYYDEITFRGFGGAQRSIKVWFRPLEYLFRPASGYSLLPISILFPRLDNGYSLPHSWLSFIQKVELPNGQSYNFYYNQYGEIARVELPTGGAYEYDYDKGLNNGFEGGVIGGPAQGQLQFNYHGSLQIYRRMIERRVYGDAGLEQITTYSRPETKLADGFIDSAGLVSVDDLDARRVLLKQRIHRFMGRGAYKTFWDEGATYDCWNEGKEYRTEWYGSTLGLMKEEDLTWKQADGTAPSTCEPTDNPRVTETKTVLSDTNQISKQERDYDTYNNLIAVRDYDFGVGAPGQLLRRKAISYRSVGEYGDEANHVVLRNLPEEETVYDDHDNLVQRTLREYDIYTPGLTESGAVQHDAAFGPNYTIRGNVTALKRWRNTDGAWITTTNQYDDAGNIVKIIDANGNSPTTFSYADSWGNAACAPAGGNAAAYATEITNALQHVTRTSHDSCTGKPVLATDANSTETSFSYNDSLDRPTQVINGSNRAVDTIRRQTTFTYDDAGHKITITTDKDVYGDNVLKDVTVYDGFGRTIEARHYESALSYLATETSYDPFGRIRRVSNPFRPNDVKLYTEYEYDALDRKTRIVHPDGAIALIVYQGNGTDFVDEAANQRLTVTDALGRLTQVTEDPMGQQHSTTYAYDALDNLKMVQQGVQSRTFNYDSLSRLINATNPENGTISYTYDNNGNLTLKSDIRGAITYTYDPLNRVTKRTYTDGSPEVIFTYDAPGVANSKGRLTSVSSTNSTSAYDEYDEMGRVKRSSQITGGTPYSFTYGYNRAGKQILQGLPSGRFIWTAYDDASRIKSVSAETAGGGSRSYVSEVGYAPHGPISAMRLGNGLWEHTEFDPGGRLQPTVIGLGASATGPSSTSVFGLGNYYGDSSTNNGNVLTQTITLPGLPAIVQNYTYDAHNRIKSYSEPGWSQSYGPDRYGNVLISGNVRNLANTPQSFDPATNKIAGGLWSYKEPPGGTIESGNVTMDGAGNTFTYNLDNLLTGFNGSTATCLYDGEGHRVKRTVAGTSTVFVYNAFGQLAAEYSSQAPSGNGDTNYLTPDHLESTRVVTGQTGGVLERNDYTPYGELIPSSVGGRSSVEGYNAAEIVTQHFSGKERDPESGLDYFGARYFSGAQGRFTTTDPYIPQFECKNASCFNTYIGDPQNWNRYAYTRNNPLSYIDTDGEKTELAVGRNSADNPFGHIALIINGKVYSYGTNYNKGARRDWGASADTYLNAQTGMRQTELLQLNVTPEQEQSLQQNLDANDPNAKGTAPYDALGNSCVTVTEKALEKTGILPTPQPGPVVVGKGGALYQAGAYQSITPNDLAERIKKSPGMVQHTSTSGQQQVSVWRSFFNLFKKKTGSD